jgi:enoyl-CoA hydratase
MDAAQTLVEVVKRDGVAVLTLTNPPANAYSYDMMRQLDEAILNVRMDDDVHVIVLTGGSDKFFCGHTGFQVRVLPTRQRNTQPA